MIVNPKRPFKTWALIKRAQSSLPLATTLYAAIGGAFIAGFFISDPKAMKTHDPIHLLQMLPLISATSLYGLMILATPFVFAGYPFMRVNVEPDAPRWYGWERSRALLIAALVSLTILLFVGVQLHYQITHATVSVAWFLFIVLAPLAGLRDAWRIYRRSIVKNYLLPAAVSTVYWMVFSIYAVAYGTGTARSHPAFGTSWSLVVFTSAFLLAGALGALALSEKKWFGVAFAPAMALSMLAVFDPKDFFAMPLRMLGVA